MLYQPLLKRIEPTIGVSVRSVVFSEISVPAARCCLIALMSPFTAASNSEIFGGFGSTAQHSYFQLLHQGTAQCSADIIYSPNTQSPLSNAQA